MPALRTGLHHFAQALFIFAAQSSACNRMHSVMQRCARWLLATHDRVSGDEFFLTHLFLSQMVGVRRSSVTLAAESLRDAGAITYARGRIRVLDRARLRERSCDCYDIVRSTYDRLLEGQATANPLTGVAFAQDGKSIVHAGDPGASDGDGNELQSTGITKASEAIRAALLQLSRAESELRLAEKLEGELRKSSSS
jgi:hypothetical protein